MALPNLETPHADSMPPAPLRCAIPRLIARVELEFAEPVRPAPLPVDQLRSLTGPALDHHHRRHPRLGAAVKAVLVHPDDTLPQFYTVHFGPALHPRAAKHRETLRSSTVLRGEVHAFLADPAPLRALLAAWEDFGRHRGWPICPRSSAAVPFALRHTFLGSETPPPWAGTAQGATTAAATWRIHLETPLQLQARVCDHHPDAPPGADRAHLHDLLVPAQNRPGVPRYFRGQPLDGRIVLHKAIHGAVARLKELATLPNPPQAPRATPLWDHRHADALLWEQARLTAATLGKCPGCSLSPKREDLTGIIGTLDLAGPPTLGDLLHTAASLGTGARVNFGLGRLRIETLP